ncbi:MAG: methyltransferase domain-containing protein [Ilumatobacteraceae bacterium]|nr:methyltransferase domain-containing protein [Ilumatobacteraceae bacterium]
MDLTERGDSAVRHPWEVQRFEAYRRVLADHGALDARRVLDVGAGDGWFSEGLLDHLPDSAEIVCWDVNYDDNDLEPSHPSLVRTRDRPSAGYDLVLLLDVLEHIQDPGLFVGSVLAPLTSSGTRVLVAVPAHQRLFSSHDEALGHYRRYARRQLLDQVSPWLDVVEDGPLFTSLLLPRAASAAIERVAPRPAATAGVGNWGAGRIVTAAVNRALAADARSGRAARRLGVRLPGLSHWAFGVVR